MDYEDELERMRAQRARKNSKKSINLSDNSRESDDSLEFDDFFNLEDSVDLEDSEFENFDLDEDLEFDRFGRPANRPQAGRSGQSDKKKQAPRSRQTERARQEKHTHSSKHPSRPDRSGKRRDQQYYDKKKRKRKRRILAFELLLLIIVAAGAFWLFRSKTTTDSGYWNVAVFGVDSRDGSLGKGALSDVEMICSINKATGEIKLVSVYRDTYLKIDSKGTYFKVNEAYFKGGPDQAVYALRENLDLQIDNYATFNWKAVADAINILGGIDLEITGPEFEYINAFITETVESTGVPSQHLKSAGMNHLDGVQAVSYARLRLMDTDFNRTERQRKVVSLAMEKAKSADFSVLNNILVTVWPQVKTDIGVTDLIPFAKGVSKYHLGETAGFPFSRTTAKIDKRDCVIATTLESNVVQLHQFLFGVTEYTPSDAVKKISAKIAKVSGIGDVGENSPTGTSAPKKKPAETTAAPETTEVETSPAESTQESTEATIPETTTAESTERATDTNGNLVGPGAEAPTNQTTGHTKPDSTAAPKPEETKVEVTEAETTVAETAPPETSKAEIIEAGPGSNGPGVS